MAEPGFTFDVTDAKGESVHGSGQKALYTYSVSGTSTNDLMQLLGNPAILQMANGTRFQNNLIIWDLANNKMFTPPGEYHGYGPTNEVGTNALPFTKKGLLQ